jgi:hypothetical protein
MQSAKPQVSTRENQWLVSTGTKMKRHKKQKLTKSTQKGSSWIGKESLPTPISRHIFTGWAKDQVGVCSGLQPSDDDNNDDDDSQVIETADTQQTMLR